MDAPRIAELLQPFLTARAPTTAAKPLSFRAGFSREQSASLSPSQLQQISTYINLLLRWNARINLTSVRDPEAIVSRHFGESLFAARHLLPTTTCVGAAASPAHRSVEPDLRMPHPARFSQGGHLTNDQRPITYDRLTDLGSGAGFPGLPIKIWEPHIHLTLIESNQKKATFLREVARALTLTDINVFSGRADDIPAAQADIVTLRAVERFDQVLPAAARLLAPGGRLALLIGQAQVARTHALLPEFLWSEPVPIPSSSNRILLLGRQT